MGTKKFMCLYRKKILFKNLDFFRILAVKLGLMKISLQSSTLLVALVYT